MDMDFNGLSINKKQLLSLAGCFLAGKTMIKVTDSLHIPDLDI